MSPRRKNAGAGYGYMFSGAFSKKADAVKKEKKRKGSFVKAVFLPTGMRYAVMTPRTNPIKRKKKVAKKETKGELLKRRLAELAADNARAVNPTELIVMGANPSPRTHEITAKPGETITIRVNPETNLRKNIYLGFGPAQPLKSELSESRKSFRAGVRRRRKKDDEYYAGLKRSARPRRGQAKLDRLFHEVYSRENPICGKHIGSEICTRRPRHRGPCLPEGATMRTRTRLRKGWQPRQKNPSAEALREKFTGAEADRVNVYNEPHMPAGDYALLGKLLVLYVKPIAGGQVQMIKPIGTQVVADESTRIWFVRGDQDVTAALNVFGARDRGAGIFELGEARRIDYKQRKEQVPHPEQDEWRHEFGEENGIRPTVLFDVNAKRLLLEGGDYEIRREGIVN